MTSKKTDDVVHLLSVAGDGSANYRTFGQITTGSRTAPLIDAVLVGTPAPGPSPASSPDARRDPLAPLHVVRDKPRQPPVKVEQQAPATTRALSDLLKILENPGRPKPKAGNATGLQSLFERLDR